MSERDFTARVHRVDGDNTLLRRTTVGGKPDEWIDFKHKGDEPVRRYVLSTSQPDAPDTYDYEFEGLS